MRFGKSFGKELFKYETKNLAWDPSIKWAGGKINSLFNGKGNLIKDKLYKMKNRILDKPSVTSLIWLAYRTVLNFRLFYVIHTLFS